MNKETQWEAAREKEMDDYFESFYEDSDYLFKCIYCGEEGIEASDMADFYPDKEEGICNKCVCNDAHAADWGI